jgi:class 3 adenylate cyclase/tetratricopeptide (TPR) repeat protein
MSLVCSSCGAEAAPGQRFCGHCGHSLGRACSSCGAENAPEHRFCATCGKPLENGAAAGPPGNGPTAVAERRLVSVLFADLVGFTTLSEHRDPEEVRELLSRYFDRCRTLIERYGGTVEKFIGDAVMAVWGTPVAREDDSERAVRAALALTSAVTALGAEVGMPELRIRAGVLTGNAAVEVGAEGEGMVLGDTVNTASRLQSIAAPGSVLVDDVTRRATEAAIDYEDAGLHQVKGREQPVHAWTALRVVAGIGGARRGAGLEAPLVGRERELETIIEVAEDTVANRTARLVTVTGDAGAGKSRLLWEFFKYIDGIEDVRWWHQGRCLAYGEGVSYWALAEMVRARAGITEEDGGQQEGEKLQAVIERFVTDERERRLVAPRMAQLLGLEERSAGEAADLFSGWRLFFERMADAQPVVLAFEDLQWADSGLLDFIDYLLEWSADYPIFILALGRTELESRRANWGTAIRLGSLPDTAMQELLAGLVPGLPSELAARILERAEGVPLYAVETVRMLLDRGVLTQEGSRYVVTGTVQDLEVPETLQALAAARLDNLDASERGALQDAAVLGISFSASMLAAISQRREPEVRQTLDSLVRKQVLGYDEDPRSSEQGQYHFLQGLLRTIALSTLSRRDRKARHLAAAEQLRAHWEDSPEIAEVLASHYLAAVEADRSAPDVDTIRGLARSTLTAAGQRAASLALGHEARRHFEQAAELAVDAPQRAELLAEAGTAAARAADLTGAAALLEEAIAELDKAGLTVEAAHTRARLVDVLVDENRLGEAAELVDRAREALTDEVAQAELMAKRGRLAFLSGDFRRAFDEADHALAIADPKGLTPIVADALMTKSIALYYDVRLTEAAALMALGLELALEADLTEAALRAYFNLGGFRHVMGRVDEGEELLDRGIALARERGSRVWERDLLAQKSEMLIHAGRWDEATALGQELVATGTDSTARIVRQAWPLVWSARGDRAELEAYLAPGREGSEWNELATYEVIATTIALHALGRTEEAMANMAEALDGVRKFATSVAMYMIGIQDVLIAAGDLDRLELMANDHAFRGSLNIEAQRRRARAFVHLGHGRGRDAEEELRQAITELRSLRSVYPLARTLLDLSELLTDQGRGDEAVGHLREARALFSQLRATPWLERTEALLAPLGSQDAISA